MNETTWIISPNWVAWTLLGMATASLAAIAIWLWTQRQITKQTAAYGCGSVVSWVALVLAIISGGCVFFNTSDPNNASMLITALGVLVTLLVTWNIWQVIDTKNTVRKAEEASNKIQTFEKEIDRYKNLHRPFLAYTEGMRDFDAQKYSSALCKFLDMADLYVDYEIEFNSFINSAIESAILCIKKEPWNYKNRVFVDRVDKIVGRLRRQHNAITPLEARLGRIRKELEQICEENVPNPYQIQKGQNMTNTDTNPDSE